ncbi:hypothetical protein DFP72DRAFT_910910 [Ephemerocybe angulata]|uniref:Uncharacterized protein n=1 Tax=Ephemerocybe angulata TaxID=980116 RepID=A0A8H6HQ29_9AGAR|nr:hypothetical protein DFP72DRAFT_910910 [Tulosesus angulatus]
MAFEYFDGLSDDERVRFMFLAGEGREDGSGCGGGDYHELVPSIWDIPTKDLGSIKEGRDVSIRHLSDPYSSDSDEPESESGTSGPSSSPVSSDPTDNEDSSSEYCSSSLSGSSSSSQLVFDSLPQSPESGFLPRGVPPPPSTPADESIQHVQDRRPCRFRMASSCLEGAGAPPVDWNSELLEYAQVTTEVR